MQFRGILLYLVAKCFLLLDKGVPDTQQVFECSCWVSWTYVHNGLMMLFGSKGRDSASINHVVLSSDKPHAALDVQRIAQSDVFAIFAKIITNLQAIRACVFATEQDLTIMLCACVCRTFDPIAHFICTFSIVLRTACKQLLVQENLSPLWKRPFFS